MTALPQLVAAFHSLVGLAAVAVAAAAFYAPHKFGIGEVGAIHPASLIEMGLGVAVGAVTFTGSIIAFAKLQALMSGAPLVFPGQHILNAALGIGIIVLIVAVIITQSPVAFWGLVAVSLLLGFLLILPIGGADMPVVVSMLNSYSGWAACGIGFTLSNTLADRHRRAGRLFGRDPQLHHVQGHEPLDLQRDPGRLRHRRRQRRPRRPRAATSRSKPAAPRTPPSS